MGGISMSTAEAANGQDLRAPGGRRRLLTGLRPTGQLHLGNYIGTLEKDIRHQTLPEYTCFFLVADYHALTKNIERVGDVSGNVRDTLLDMLAAGIDPQRS